MIFHREILRQDFVGPYVVSTIVILSKNDKNENEMWFETMSFKNWNSINELPRVSDAKLASLAHKLAFYEVWERAGWFDKVMWYIERLFAK